MKILPPWLRGLFAVLPTPMVAGGDLDLESLDRLVDYYLERGATGLVPVSIAGEGDRLDDVERRSVIRRVVQQSRGRAPVIAGILETGVEDALAQARAALECGVDGLLVKPPMGGDSAVLEHFGAIARSLRLPMVVLDYPKAGPLLSTGLIRTLVEAVPEVCGIKLEDEPTAVKMAQLRALLGDRIRLFGGLGGAFCLQELEHGADGFFTGCPYPELLVQAIGHFHRRDGAGAQAAFEALRPVVMQERLHPGTMIAQRKAILCELGVLREPALRPPTGTSRHAAAPRAGVPRR